MKIGISLCGGGARGMAHIGVLKAIEDLEMDIYAISGASAGAIVGSLFAGGRSPDDILKVATESTFLKAFKPGIRWTGLGDLQYLEDIIRDNLAFDTFEGLPRDLHIGVTNLNTGEPEIMDKGIVSKAVAASSAIPGVFKPVEIGKYKYIDGGFMNNLPVEPLLEICDLVIGVNVNAHGYRTVKELDQVFEIAQRCFDLVMWNNTREHLAKCHTAIELSSAYDYSLFEFGKAAEICDKAYHEARPMLENLQNHIEIMHSKGEHHS